MSADLVAPRQVAVAAGPHGAVAAGHPAAAGAALDVLRRGGNAVEAAIAGSAMQCVVELPWCGLGGDAFAMIRTPTGETLAFNGSGTAPASILDAMGGRAQVPRHGALSVGVPGVVDAWAQLAERFATAPLAELVAPARRAAADGFPLDERLRHALAELAADPGTVDMCRSLLAEHGSDDRLRLPELASTFAAIAEGGREGFYEGPVAERIAAHVAGIGGAMSRRDLSEHRGAWAQPLATTFRGATVHVQPPVSMGVLLLVALRLAERLAPLGVPADVAARTDLLVAIKHTVFRRALAGLGDPAFVGDAVTALLGDDWIDTHLHAEPATAMVPGGGGDTTSIAVTDAAGTSISFIHSLFNEFGSRVLVPGTGIVLNDRLANLRNGPGPNGLRGGKRPMHTLHSWIADLGDGRTLAGATPGGRGQVQTNLQVLLGMVDDGLDLASSVGRSRWVNGLPRRAPDDDTLYVEWDFEVDAVSELRAKGHRIEVSGPDADDHFGACTIVERGPLGCGAVADHRRDCAAMAW
jgi:gamma-glutamyltranspeptidase/glutathione hydrolase